MESGTAMALGVAGGTETVLLVEDQEAVRLLLAGALRGRGYRVLEAGDGEQAVALMERHHEEVDLLLTDVVMPRLSGPEVARRAVLLKPGLKVLYVSGYTEDEMIHRGAAGGRVQFLSKPFRTGVLLAAVRQALDH